MIAEQTTIQQVVDAVRTACGSPAQPVLLHGPCLRGNELRYLKDCVDTEWISTGGEFVNQFEERLAAFTGSRHAIAVVNGTSALHIALMLAGVAPDDEVLLPALTFVASANAVAYCRAIPHFCDVEPATFGIDPDRLAEHLQKTAEVRNGHCYNRQTGRRIAAILPVHALGHPVRLDRLLEIAEQWNLPVVEDAAESLGSYYHGRHTGTLGKIGALSFNSNKIVTTGGGGAILTDDPELAERAKHLTTTAKLAHPWEFIHDEVGYNYRMPNINAALGCAQIERLPGFLLRKRTLAKQYMDAFADFQDITVLEEPEGCRSNYWLNTLIFDRADMSRRDEILQTLNDAGLQSRPIWRPMHLLPMYSSAPRMDLATTEDLVARVINVPSGTALISR